MYLLDTNTISAHLKRIGPVKTKIDRMIFDKEQMSIDGIIYYEIKSGLLHVNATAKLRQFNVLLQEIGTLWANQAVVIKHWGFMLSSEEQARRFQTRIY